MISLTLQSSPLSQEQIFQIVYNPEVKNASKGKSFILMVRVLQGDETASLRDRRNKEEVM